jgi:hypothetical protein
MGGLRRNPLATGKVEENDGTSSKGHLAMGGFPEIFVELSDIFVITLWLFNIAMV